MNASQDDEVSVLEYIDYKRHGGGFSEEEFNEFSAYTPTDSDISDVRCFFREASDKYVILIAKVYHIISRKKICLVTDWEVNLECRVLLLLLY